MAEFPYVQVCNCRSNFFSFTNWTFKLFRFSHRMIIIICKVEKVGFAMWRNELISVTFL